MAIYDIAEIANSATTYYHGTKAILQTGDVIEPGFTSNYGSRKKLIMYILLQPSTLPFGAPN